MTPADRATAEHLGGGAYVHFDGYAVVLTANHHDPAEATDTVCLDPYAFKALERWIAQRVTRTSDLAPAPTEPQPSDPAA